MTRIWESSVVIALRDLQWKYTRPHMQYPEEYVALDGNAERGAGDAFMGIKERYLLVEAKSTVNQIKEEWNGKGGRKGALLAIDNELLNTSATSDNYGNLGRSMQSHFFAYWKTEQRISDSASGAIFMEPYIGGVYRAHGFDVDQDIIGIKEEAEDQRQLRKDERFNAAKKVVASMGLAGSWARKNLWDQVATNISRYDAAPVELAMQGLVKFALAKRDATSWDHLGLPFEEFQIYIKYLINNSGKSKSESEPICAIVMSSSGSHFIAITNTSQLAKIFEPDAHFTEALSGRKDVIKAEFETSNWGASVGYKYR